MSELAKQLKSTLVVGLGRHDFGAKPPDELLPTGDLPLTVVAGPAHAFEFGGFADGLGPVGVVHPERITKVEDSVVGSVAVDVVDLFRNVSVMPQEYQPVRQVDLTKDADLKASVRPKRSRDLAAFNAVRRGIAPKKKSVGMIVENIFNLSLGGPHPAQFMLG